MANDGALESDLRELIRYIQHSRGIDFRGYKKTSLRRRLGHRMDAVGTEDFAAYHAFLEAHPQEFAELLNTVLINVTSFFRDPDAWEVLRSAVVPRIVEQRQGAEDDRIRVWSVGCATGEEPYSLAMLFAEALGTEAFARRVKIYATDLDEGALHAARRATYAPREVEGVPPGLLERYFERTSNHYVAVRELRKCVIFGRHNVSHDAPIGRADLVVCRNLLIYLETETQDVVLPRLHYALRDDGFLFLGKAETQLARSGLFEPLDLKHRIFRKLPQDWRRLPGGGALTTGGAADDRTAPPLHLRMLESIADSSATAYLAVDAEGALVFANFAAKRLLDVADGDIGRPFQDLAVSYRPTELRSRIEEAQRLGRPVRLEHQEHLRPPADPVRLTVEIMPIAGTDGRPTATLLSFTDTTRTFLLQQELHATQESLETHVEELQSSNEELETTNEELQSTNEELETTNEELQSTNEELETMNEELRSTNEELEAANEEMRRQSQEAADYRIHAESVLRGLDVGVTVLDGDLKVRSWNRWNENAWGLRAEEVLGKGLLDLDIGLPVGRLRSGLREALAADAPLPELGVQAVDRRGRALRCRIRLSPLLYDGRPPHGVAMVVEDVTEAERDGDHAAYIGRILGRSTNEVYFLDPATFRFLLVNHTAERKLGHPLTRLRQMSLPDFMPTVPAGGLKALVGPLLKGEHEEVVFETTMRNGDGRTHPVELCMQHFADEDPPILVAIVHDTTERQSLRGAPGRADGVQRSD